MNILKETTSLSPLTMKEIPAKIIEDDGLIYMIKEDEKGNSYRELVEKDPLLYTQITSNKISEEIPFKNIHLYVSSRCNLNCPVCYEAYKTFPELTLDEIESFLSNHKNKYVVLSGREPTMREDIIDIIKIVNKNNYAVLLTNGLKLADYEYTLSLKEKGLYCILFSLNGFDDKVYQSMNGRPLLDLKLKALENIKKVGIRTHISVTLARGINDDQIKDIYDYCVKNSDFINEIRIRTIQLVGRNPGIQSFFMSELLDCVCKALDISKDAVLKECHFLDEAAKTFHLETFLQKFCTIRFHILLKQNKSIPIGDRITFIPKGPLFIKYLTLPFFTLRYYGMPLIKEMLYLMKVIKSKGDVRMLDVVLKYWPNVYNVDLNEIKKCSGGYYRNKKCSSFCLGNIMELPADTSRCIM